MSDIENVKTFPNLLWYERSMNLNAVAFGLTAVSVIMIWTSVKFAARVFRFGDSGSAPQKSSVKNLEISRRFL